MIPVYCISGLGADERVFFNLHLSGCHLYFIKWMEPLKNESIESYAQRLCKQVYHDEPVLIGVSFGGMMAVEMAKIISCKKVFLVSSINSSAALPLWMKVCGYLKLNRLLPVPRKNRLFIPLENYFLGPETITEKELVNDFRHSVDKKFLHWSIDKILNWKNKTVNSHTVLLMGDKDKFFSVKKSRPDYIIPSGTHFMVYNRAVEISRIIQSQLSGL